MQDSDIVAIVTNLITLLLFIWSEYLGVSPQHKSNAVTQLVTCLLTPTVDKKPVVVENS